MNTSLTQKIKQKSKQALRKAKSIVTGRPQHASNLRVHEIKGGILVGHKLYGDTNGVWFSEMIEGIYDKEIFEMLESAEIKKKISGGTIVEIGAHIGYHTLAFALEAGERGHVYAFEPNPHNLERLQRNLSENAEGKTNLKKRISVFEMAVSDKDGSEEFVFGSRVDKGSSSGSFLDRAHTLWEKSVYESEKIGYKRMAVMTRTLDSLRKDSTIPRKITLCKIDVEGAEYLVLSGMFEVMHSDRPLILIEIHSIFNMWKAQEIFAKENYTLKLLKEEGDGRCFFMASPK